LLPALRAVRRAADEEGSGSLIYAGRVVATGIHSSQLTGALGREVNWDALILQQFDNREAYERYLQDETVRAALAEFPDRFAHGMRRSAIINLLLPQALLARKAQRFVTRAPAILPIQPTDNEADAEFAGVVLPAFEDVNGPGSQAIVVVNLILEGDARQRAANASYSRRMLDAMADLGHGPIHVGEAVPIDHPLEFTSVALVYYPGMRYFRDLVLSSFFQAIIGDKQVADTQATITVPITDQL
jgi:hypothetical protein